jgi:hypothetical protein
MEPGAWLVLAALIGGKSMVIAGPAPDLFACERARSVIDQPTHDKTFCTPQRPKADAYDLPLPAVTS